MDAERFDSLAEALARPRERRALVAALAGSMLGLAAAPAAADRRHKRQRRRKKRNRKQVGRNDAARCAEILHAAYCTYGRVGAVDAWTCAPGTSLDYQNLSNCDFRGSIFRQVSFNEANFERSNLNNVDFEGSQLWSAKLDGAAMVQAQASHANLGGVNAYSADFRDTKFIGASLNSADLTAANLKGAIFQGADLRGVHWSTAPWDKEHSVPLTRCPDDAMLLWPNDCCGHLNGYTTPMC